MNRLKRIAVMLPFAASLGAMNLCAVSPAYAADGKGYPGISCVPISGGVPRFEYGAIGNLSTTSFMWVECPIINDSSAGLYQSWVKVRDRSLSDSIGCTLYSMHSPAGSSYSYAYTTRSRGYIGDVETIGSGGVSGGSAYRYFLSCSIPPRSSSTALPSQIEQYFAEEP
jgi:hypothetical protein